MPGLRRVGFHGLRQHGGRDHQKIRQGRHIGKQRGCYQGQPDHADVRGGLRQGAGHQLKGRVQYHTPSVQAFFETAQRQDREHLFRIGRAGQPGAGQLQRLQGGTDRTDQERGPGTGVPGGVRQCGGSRIYRHGYDPGPARESQRGRCGCRAQILDLRRQAAFILRRVKPGDGGKSDFFLCDPLPIRLYADTDKRRTLTGWDAVSAAVSAACRP